MSKPKYRKGKVLTVEEAFAEIAKGSEGKLFERRKCQNGAWIQNQPARVIISNAKKGIYFRAVPVEDRAEAKSFPSVDSDLLKVAEFFIDLTSESSGVAGWHLNGDLAEWKEFQDEIDLAKQAVSKAKGGEE